MKQHTLKDSFTLSSVGLHTGLYVTATFHPAPENTGIRLRRVDLPGQPCHQALADYVSGTERGTVLERGKWKISTVEHALSALYALGVDNCIIDVDAPEMPILDGSARLFVKEIQRVGLEEQNAEQQVYVVTEPVEYISEHGHSMRIEPCDHYEVNVTIAFDSKLLREQHAVLKDLNDYANDVSAARTFCFVREIEPLLRVGLIKGGDPSSTRRSCRSPVWTISVISWGSRIWMPRNSVTSHRSIIRTNRHGINCSMSSEIYRCLACVCRDVSSPINPVIRSIPNV